METNWKNKKILIGISGGIAAYKINFLVRELVKIQADVRLILSPTAEKMVSKLTLSTLSQNKVLSGFYDSDEQWNNHVDLALWADVFVIDPATANTLAKMANGLSDNLLIATYLSAKCPVLFAPAMDLDMNEHPSTKRNIELLQMHGNHLIPSEYGELASGLVGNGRMAEIDTILSHIESFLHKNQKENTFFQNKKVLITAGPTYEAIDPVRFIGNHSSGKMGFAIAQAALNRGAKVVLVTGPTALDLDHPNLKLINVQSAKEMQQSVLQHYDNSDVVIMSAAVADYTPKVVATEKIKKKEGEMTIELVKNPDILMDLGSKKQNQFLVGFALETQNEVENATDKLKRKNLDMIILNSLKEKGAGFKTETNKIIMITKDNKKIYFELKDKIEVANDILNNIEELMLKK